jgi:hypothetical protein
MSQILTVVRQVSGLMNRRDFLKQSAGLSKTDGSGHNGICIAGLCRRFPAIGLEAAQAPERAVHCY